VGVPLVVMPGGRFSVAPLRFVPAKVTPTLVPCAPDVGAMLVSVGAAGEPIVNVKALLVPPMVLTVMFCAPDAAVPEITKFAVI